MWIRRDILMFPDHCPHGSLVPHKNKRLALPIVALAGQKCDTSVERLTGLCMLCSPFFSPVSVVLYSSYAVLTPNYGSAHSSFAGPCLRSRLEAARGGQLV